LTKIKRGEKKKKKKNARKKLRRYVITDFFSLSPVQGESLFGDKHVDSFRSF